MRPDRREFLDLLSGGVGSLPDPPGWVHLLPASRQHDGAPCGKTLALDLGDERSTFERGVRVKGSEETACDEVVEALLVGGEHGRIHALCRGDDGVVVGHLRVVNVARGEGQGPSGQDRADKGEIQAHAGGLDMAPQCPIDAAGEMARRGAWVGDERLFVQGLREGEGMRCGEGVARVGGLLQCGEVVEQWRPFSPCLLLDLHDRAPAALHLGGDGVGLSPDREPAALRVAPESVVRARAGLEGGDDLIILDGHKGGDLLVTRDNEGERRRLHAPQGIDAIGAGTAGADCLRARRVQADEPVGLLPTAGGIAQAAISGGRL